MTLLLSADDVVRLSTDDVALKAMRRGFEVEAAGHSELPIRIDAPSPTGFFRAMPAVLGERMGCKIMTLVRGSGTRYLVLLYDVGTGALLALVDADELTKIRTAATTALAAEYLAGQRIGNLAVIGSGFEARGHLELFARLWPLEQVSVFSRSPENRERFCDEMSVQTGLEVRPAESTTSAVSGADTVLLATKSPAVVVDGADFDPGTVVLSIGSTRPDLRELDLVSFRRAAVVVVDAMEQVLADSGDVREAFDHGAIDHGRIRRLADYVADRVGPSRDDDDRDLVVFKSAGTALQDLALTDALYERALATGVGTDIGEVSRLKPFNGKGGA